MLAYYDYPVVHWRHLRTTNPIESPFATVRARTDLTKYLEETPAKVEILVKTGAVDVRCWERSALT